jgi:large subunit ribosomal protein L16
MHFVPKKSKFKKLQKGSKFNKIAGVSSLWKLKFGVIGLKSIVSGRISSDELEAARQSISKVIKKFGKLRTNIFPDTPITKKPIEVRMGKGKGSVNHWVFRILAGVTIFEIETSNVFLGLKSLKTAQYRLSIKTRIVTK